MPGQQREVSFRFLTEPTDVNFGGKVHGGMVMKWIDQAGYACAVGWSAKYCVTVAVGGIQFVEPVLIGDLVTVRCKLIHTGSTSMHFAVDVLARDLKTQHERLATSCVIVFVALDGEDGRPTSVPPWHPVDDEDRRLAEYAQRMIELSKAMQRQVAEFKALPTPPG
jgi:acyl-CoA hydrolase